MKGSSTRLHFNMTCRRLTALLLLDIVLQLSSVEAAADPTSQIKDYDAKVCNNEPTCNLTTVSNLTADKLTFPYRDCMCDFECSEYDDCCSDSQYIKAPKLHNPPKTYYCSPEARVYMVVSCLPDYHDERIKDNCAKALKPLEENNFALIVPVTNTDKRISYANAYCALCNRDENFTPWGYASTCGKPVQGYLEQREAEVRKESSTAPPTAPPIKNSATTPSKSNNNRLNLNVHLNPGVIFGKKDPNAGFNKEISLPTFGNLGNKLANKTFGSETGFFGAKTGRRRRQVSNPSSGIADIYTYARKLNEIMKVVKYDPSVKEFIANFEDEILLCKLGFKMPDTIGKQVRKCIPHIISECPNDNAEANKRCHSYLRIVHDMSGKKSYRNIDCAKCNGVDPNVVKLTGCQQQTRVGASSLFASDGKGNANNEVCKDPALAAKLC